MMDKYEKIDYDVRKTYKILHFYLEDKEDHVDSHWHNSVEIIFPIYGSLRIVDNGVERHVKTSDLYIVNSKHVHSIKLCGDTNAYIGYCLQINYSYIQWLNVDIEDIEFIQPYSASVIEYCKRIIIGMIKEENKKVPFNNVYLESQLLLLLYTLLKYMRKNKLPDLTQKNYHKKIPDIIKYIEDNYKEDISVEEISQHFDLSTGYLSKLFKDNLGKSPKEYLLQYRLKKATQNLIESNEPIIDIALNHGFSSLNSFYVQFKKYYGLSPAKYRKIGHKEGK